MQRFLVITLPHWSVTARARLVQQPVLVVVRHKGARMVHAANRLARDDGVERGMPLAQAKALLRCRAHELEHDAAADRRALHTLARWCHRLSPLVQVLQHGDPAAIVVDLTGLERVHRGEDRLLVHLRARLDRARVECTLWTASTQAAARAAGWAAPSGHDGIIKHGDERWRTRACPVESLQIDGDLVAMLHEVNIRTIDDLRQVQRQQVAARFGQGLLDRLDAIHGQVIEPFEPIRCIPDVQGRVVFDGPCPQLEALCRAVQECFDQVERQLHDRARGARSFTVRVRCSDLPQHAWIIRCTQPVRSWESVRPLVWPTLQDLPLGHGVEQVQIIARSLRRMAPGQGTLHGARSPTEHGALWLDGVRERLGPDAVGVPMVRAVRCHAWHQGASPLGACIEPHADDAAPAVHGLASEPSCLWPRPEPIVGAVHDGHRDPWPMPPPMFRWRGRTWTVLDHEGPQRLGGAWWQDGDAGTRDHWRVHAAHGGGASTPPCAPTMQPGDAQRHAWLALVRDADGSWWVQGAWT